MLHHSRFVSAVLGISVAVTGGAFRPAFADTKTDSKIKSGEYEVPEFSNTKMPSISSCDPKNPLGNKSMMSGNDFLDAAVNTATTIKGAFEKEDEDDADEEVGDVDGKATLSTDCEKEFGAGRNRTNYDAEKLQCRQFDDKDFVAEIQASVEAEKKFLACQRGVLGALGGEIACFRKQITEAEQYMSKLISDPGGLSDMLKQGNDAVAEIDKEVQDREAQLKSAALRLDGGPNGNPPGLLEAQKVMTKLSADLTDMSAKAKAQVENLRSQEQRFETLVKQSTMARAMECMATQPMPGYQCVAKNTSSSKYPAGDVSPIDYIKCIYAQSPNKIVGGKRITNAAKEDAMKSEIEKVFAQMSGYVPANTGLPEFSDKDGFAKSMKVYRANTPDELLNLVSGTFNGMGAKAGGKDFYNQFARDLRRCYFRSSNKSLANDTSAQAQIERERQDANSPIRASQTAMKQSFESAQSAFAVKFKEVRTSYLAALKAATGQTISGGSTSECEKGSLEEQANCFDALTSMADSLVMGKVIPPKSALKKPALALTAGQEPIHQFASGLAAKNNPQRSIAITCKGLDDCVTQYTNLRTSLEEVVTERKNFQSNFKTQVNNSVQNAARDMAAKDTGTNFNLNKLAGAIQTRKDELMGAFAKLKVEGGIDLDPREGKVPEIDEKSGLFKPSDLMGLVLSQVTPQLPDANSKGFTDALTAVKKRDDDLEKKQDELDKTVAQALAKAAECEDTDKKKFCDSQDKKLESARDRMKTTLTQLETDIKNIDNMMLVIANDQNKIAAQTQRKTEAETKLSGEKLKLETPASVALEAGIDSDAYAKYCGGSALSEKFSKDEQETGSSKKRFGADKSGVGG